MGRLVYRQVLTLIPRPLLAATESEDNCLIAYKSQSGHITTSAHLRQRLNIRLFNGARAIGKLGSDLLMAELKPMIHPPASSHGISSGAAVENHYRTPPLASTHRELHEIRY